MQCGTSKLHLSPPFENMKIHQKKSEEMIERIIRAWVISPELCSSEMRQRFGVCKEVVRKAKKIGIESGRLAVADNAGLPRDSRGNLRYEGLVRGNFDL